MFSLFQNMLAGDESSNERSRTFIFNEESHTLGNCLTSVITKYPEVVFCGYTVAHPAEKKLHVRIQTSGPRAVDILQRGLQDLEKLCDEITTKFKGAMAEHKNNINQESKQI